MPSPSRYQVDDVPPPEHVPSWWEGLLRYAWFALVPLVIFGLVALLEARPGGVRPVAGGRVAVYDLVVGDCFDAPGVAITRSQVDVRACTEAHQYEVVAVLSYRVEESDVYPGDDVVLGDAGPECERQFAEYVGIEYSRSIYVIEYWIPTPDGWEAGDRLVLCAAFHPDDPELESSIRGSRR